MSTATLGLVGSRGPSGGGTQVPSAFVTFTTRSDWVAYRHPSKPTAAKSPRVPPVKMSVSVGGLVVRSILVMIPSFRLPYKEWRARVGRYSHSIDTRNAGNERRCARCCRIRPVDFHNPARQAGRSVERAIRAERKSIGFDRRVHGYGSWPAPEV